MTIVFQSTTVLSMTSDQAVINVTGGYRENEYDQCLFKYQYDKLLTEYNYKDLFTDTSMTSGLPCINI
jgi:hypothetical protein